MAHVGEPEVPLEFPRGWEADPNAFKSGLDFPTPEMTQEDVQSLTAWYEQTLGYVPKSVMFGLCYQPTFLKANRGKWEVAIRTLPKQVVPYILLRHHTITQSVEGLREAALLAKAWGITRDYVIRAISATVFYFAGIDGYYAPFEALEDILEGEGWACETQGV